MPGRGPYGVPFIPPPPPLFQPKVTWLKNSVEIGADPKFLSRHGLGVLSLLIRRPGPFDGGTYGCRAVNEMGEATTECRLDVRGEIWGWGGVWGQLWGDMGRMGSAMGDMGSDMEGYGGMGSDMGEYGWYRVR